MSSKTAVAASGAGGKGKFSKDIFAEYLPLVDPISNPIYKEVNVKEVHYLSQDQDRVNLVYTKGNGEDVRKTLHLSAFGVDVNKHFYVLETYYNGWMA